MNDSKSQAGKPTLKQPHHSDGSELKPAAVQANQRHDEDNQGQPVQPSAISGSTLDDEGLINNFAVEPTVYPSEYPSPRQQGRYVVMGVGAVLFIAVLIYFAFVIS